MYRLQAGSLFHDIAQIFYVLISAIDKKGINGSNEGSQHTFVKK